VERAQRAASSPALPLLPRIDNLPTAQDLVAQGVSLPALQLLLLAYDDLPANRYVLLNGRRLREGDEVADGIRVESIVPTGVVLNASGRRFVLLAGS
jgi:general secretion pathway protein B